MKSLGICCGASTITVVELEKNGDEERVLNVHSKAHEGNPKRVIRDLIDKVELDAFDRMTVTGRKFRSLVDMTNISEPLATEKALKFIDKDEGKFNAVVSAGGETFMVYRLNNRGEIQKVYTGNKCASGTGEFFLQQIRRMDVDIEEAIKYAQSEKPYHVSGRCSVFCKSDCTHATNKGVPKGRVVAGLCKMMAGKVMELLKNVPKNDIMLVGGTTKNRVMMDYLSKDIENLVVPEEATYFEALGAAVWGTENPTKRIVDKDNIFRDRVSQFDYHEPLNEYEDQVTFAQMERGTPRDGDICILGLDVGSTTTKAILLRVEDDKIIASEYLRTSGDPVGASRECYKSLLDQVGDKEIKIIGLGSTGSGRKIAGLHALTEAVINEIIAHAAAAIHFDKEVDTIFEIGGQDAKYTYITNGVASDYAMNEACSAGTGSFLEESAKETLGIEMEDIADWAMKGNNPPNFNDQCAAFISSDIKNASHEGVSKEDTVAGLVYSICMNYVNRVKGSRPVGKKVFMQGGVCYNRAVPIAMAALSGKHIIVPPEPGLMGAYGVALEVKQRIKNGLMEEKIFELQNLADREVVYKKSFTCAGGKEKCDIGCTINMIEIEGKTYPFGGACNRYYNQIHNIEVDPQKHDLVAVRQRMIFEDFAPDFSKLTDDAPVVGINRSFLINSLYPLFSNFFAELGYRVVMPDEVEQEGIDSRTAPFCFPFEISHGYFKNLIEKEVDVLFLPHIQGVGVENGYYPSKVCPLVQGEPFVLRSTFEKDIPKKVTVVTPFLKLFEEKDVIAKQFESMSKELGIPKKEISKAFDKAWGVQEELKKAMIKKGREAIDDIEKDPDNVGIVMFGRPYNAFAGEANKGIPHKFASRGYTVIPVDFLDLAKYDVYEHMYWSMGQIILKGAEAIKDHPQLYGNYITNFSCGPDSFIVGYFRNIMGKKPSLTLELDNHTADAGLETRVEAFLDIVDRFRTIPEEFVEDEEDFQIAESILENQEFKIITNDGETVSLYDERVRLVFPSMSNWASRAVAAACASRGVNTKAFPPMTEEDLKIGKGNTLCKECLPLLLTTGALLNYLKERPKDEITVYFMPTAEGPCRFGQYQIFMKNLMKKKKIENVAFMSLSCDDNYGGLGTEFLILGWYAAVTGDAFQDIYNLMLVNAVDKESALKRVQEIFDEVLKGFESGFRGLRKKLKWASSELEKIPIKKPVEEIPTILLVGEIYVRSESLSRRWLPESLAEDGIATHVAPVHEWMYYIDDLFQNSLNDYPPSFAEKVANKAKHKVMVKAEKDVKDTLAKSGRYVPRYVHMDETIRAGKQFISKNLTGEAILTVGGPMAEVGTDFAGAIAIGPFGCMPNRLSESILNLNFDRAHLLNFRNSDKIKNVTEVIEAMPFLAIESDGSPFPQIIEARLETFMIQVKRLHEVMKQFD